MSKAYTSDGKRRSSMTHANHSWTCDCGRKVWGNGGKSSHQRACRTWAEAELARLDRVIPNLGYAVHRAEAEARRDALRARLGIDRTEN